MQIIFFTGTLIFCVSMNASLPPAQRKPIDKAAATIMAEHAAKIPMKNYDSEKNMSRSNSDSSSSSSFSCEWPRIAIRPGRDGIVDPDYEQ